jgi:hypothetical protein
MDEESKVDRVNKELKLLNSIEWNTDVYKSVMKNVKKGKYKGMDTYQDIHIVMEKYYTKAGKITVPRLYYKNWIILDTNERLLHETCLL